ncbi:TonB-dependent receptor domain-containing protein [Telmatospirillum sp.]|uniref:TonB-dependent receptor n=1 Tax=Telmatospirillum sp. TaxID=2079197 RepID=UPI00284971FF|nr:TonB-dependent receptor [Telmatospirillum sp.]MDR3440484.1 TonB-dependent receptor [Telmatospirillum sp.]
MTLQPLSIQLWRAGTVLAMAMPISISAVMAEELAIPTALPPVAVDVSPDLTCPLDSGSIERRQIDAKSIFETGNTAGLLSGLPGVGLATGGGISSLPIVHGLSDDRNKTLVDGVPLTSACPNHMNPALSYIAPGSLGHVAVVAGISPVSLGGDSIGGTITVDPTPPLFANPGEVVTAHGAVTTSFRSINRQIGTSGEVAAASENVSVGYSGSWTRARDSHDGDGDRILASKFENQSHNAVLAARTDDADLVVRAGHQLTPYEGFPNARMDLTGNTSNYLNAGYSGNYEWGRIEGKVYWQNAKHEMDFLAGERNTTGHMPMDTNATDAGYSLKAELPIGRDDILRIGNEYHLYRLNDWWPPISRVANGMMSPNAFLNVDQGRRDQAGTFVEWERKWDTRWSSLVGLRNDTVTTDTGNVAGYSNNMMANYGMDAAAFNAQKHQKTDVNFDATATTRFDASPTNTEEFGVARKTRSPNLYERYAWSTGGMAASMINWFGNGAEYVGNINLKPEVANTVSISTGWHDAARRTWDIKITPYYTYVQDYIGVDNLGKTSTPGINLLRFANHDSQLFGFDLSGSKSLAKDDAWGDLDLTATAGWAKGMQIDNGNRLYRMQPINAQVSLEHRLGSWNSAIELKLVNDKSVTNPLQNEHTTPGFAIVNWRTSYQWQNLTVALGIDNLFDKQYYDPNGGAYVSYWRATNTSAAMGAVPAAGRSFNAGATVRF